jgi:hypothetical protein
LVRPEVSEQVNQDLQKTALQRLLDYQQQGNEALGAYNDKRDPTEVPQQFAYPRAKSSNVEDTFYWARVKFGLKPTLRILRMVTLRGNPTDPVAFAIAQKQLYASHYFETALDLSFCVRGSDDSKQPGFYLIMAMGSEQAGLTGVKGSIVRKTAVGRSVSNLQNALTNIKTTLEGSQ